MGRPSSRIIELTPRKGIIMSQCADTMSEQAIVKKLREMPILGVDDAINRLILLRILSEKEED